MDTFTILKSFHKNNDYGKPFNLVLKDNVPLSELNKIIPWAIENFNEIIVMNDDWTKNKARYSLFALYSNMYKDKFHLHGAYWNLTKYDKEELVAVILMCYSFKSVSFRDKEIPAFILKNKSLWKKKQKELNEKIDRDCVWLDVETLTFKKTPIDTSCFGDNGNDIKDLARRAGIKACQTLHLLEILSLLFFEINLDEERRNQILELESMKLLVNSLIIGK